MTYMARLDCLPGDGAQARAHLQWGMALGALPFTSAGPCVRPDRPPQPHLQRCPSTSPPSASEDLLSWQMWDKHPPLGDLLASQG